MTKQKNKSTLGVASAIVLAAFIAAPTKAQESMDEPTFTAEAKGNALMIYSTSKTPKMCTVRVVFSYKGDAGRREGTHSCLQRQLPVGDHVEYCGVTSEHLVDAQIEGPVMATCK